VRASRIATRFQETRERSYPVPPPPKDLAYHIAPYNIDTRIQFSISQKHGACSRAQWRRERRPAPQAAYIQIYIQIQRISGRRMASLRALYEARLSKEGGGSATTLPSGRCMGGSATMLPSSGIHASDMGHLHTRYVRDTLQIHSGYVNPGLVLSALLPKELKGLRLFVT